MQELERIVIRELIGQLAKHPSPWANAGAVLHDVNGNRVGEWRFEEDPAASDVATKMKVQADRARSARRRKAR